MKKVLAIAALTVALGASALSPALGHRGGQTGPGMGMMGGGCATMGKMGHGMMGGAMMGGGKMGEQAGMGAMVAGRLAYLKSELKITDEQSEAWKSYADAVTSRVETMKGMRQTMMAAMHKGNAVERMEVRISGMEAMLEAMKAVNPATQNLYTVLTDEQKKVADQLIGVDCGAM